MSDRLSDTSGLYVSLAAIDEEGVWQIRDEFVPYLDQLALVMEPKKNIRDSSNMTTGDWHVSCDFAFAQVVKLTISGVQGILVRRGVEGPGITDSVPCVGWSSIRRVAVPVGVLDQIRAGETPTRLQSRIIEIEGLWKDLEFHDGES